jgi:hypothetical protein
VDALNQLSDRSRNRCLSIFIFVCFFVVSIVLTCYRSLQTNNNRKCSLWCHLGSGKGTHSVGSVLIRDGHEKGEEQPAALRASGIENERSTRRKPGRLRTERTPVRPVIQSRWNEQNLCARQRKKRRREHQHRKSPKSRPKTASSDVVGRRRWPLPATWEHNQEGSACVMCSYRDLWKLGGGSLFLLLVLFSRQIVKT